MLLRHYLGFTQSSQEISIPQALAWLFGGVIPGRCKYAESNTRMQCRLLSAKQPKALSPFLHLFWRQCVSMSSQPETDAYKLFFRWSKKEEVSRWRESL